MPISFDWKIEQLDRQTSDGFVKTAHWRCNATDGEFQASVYSTCGWSEGTPSIPYESLAQAAVLDWVWESVDKAAAESSLTAQIEAQKNPVTATGLPW